MKKIIFAAVGIFSASVFGAEKVTGNYNTTLGYQAGLGSDGTRVTYMGAAAGAKSFGNLQTEFVGAAAGYDTQSLWDCVGVGYHAMRKGYNNTDCMAIGARAMSSSSNCQEVVAIGANAFAGMSDLVQATWINNHFFASAMENEFWLRTNRNVAPEDSPIHYADGVLSLNANTVKINGKTTTGGEAENVVDTKLLGFDYYVDPVNGNDLQDGKSLGSPKRTIDGVYLTITNHGTRICLLPGTYTSTNLSSKLSGWTDERDPDFAVSIVAPYGPERTAIVGDNIRQLRGNDDYPASVTGCELRDFKGLTRFSPPYYAVCFSNCVFKGRCETSGGSANNGLFNGCTLYNCVIEAEMHPWSSISGSSQYKDAFSATFLDCNIIDSIIDPVWANPSGLFSCNSTFYNCYVNMGAADYADGVDGVSRFVDTTLIATNCVRFAAYGVHSSFHGCLLGLNNVENMLTPENHVLSVVTNADAVISQIGKEDYRPTVSNWAFWFNGYDSQYERMKRDSMHNSIKSILAADNTVALPETTRVAFLASIKENEDANATHGEPPPIAKTRGCEEEEPATE